MAQKWYQKASVQAALVTGLLALVAAVSSQMIQKSIASSEVPERATSQELAVGHAPEQKPEKSDSVSSNLEGSIPLTKLRILLTMDPYDPEEKLHWRDKSFNMYATVLLNGKQVASVKNGKSTEFDINPGVHRLRLVAPDYLSEEKSVQILQTSLQEIHFHLRRRDLAKQ